MKGELILILAEPEEEDSKKFYQRFQVVIKAAAAEGQVDLQVSESENDITIMIMITTRIMITIKIMITINNDSNNNIINNKLNTIKTIFNTTRNRFKT